MKKMLSSFLLSTSILTGANAEILEKNEIIPETHQVIVSKTKNIDLSGSLKKEEIFFGNMKEYSSAKDILFSGANGTLNGLGSVGNVLADGVKAGGVGLGIGLVFGVGEAIKNGIMEDKKYIYIYDLQNEKNEKTRLIILFVSNDFDNKEIIKNYLMNKEIKWEI